MIPQSVEQVIEGFESDLKLKFQFFWGHQQRSDGVVTASCLSQWYPSLFSIAGERFETAEHWMMVNKARLFGADDIASAILATDSPGKAKALGREIEGFDPDVWDAEKYGIVVSGNHAKFSQNPELADYLLRTGAKVLVEAAPRDSIWGIGLAKEDSAAQSPWDWQGQNLLGFALMKVREQLRALESNG